MHFPLKNPTKKCEGERSRYRGGAC